MSKRRTKAGHQRREDVSPSRRKFRDLLRRIRKATNKGNRQLKIRLARALLTEFRGGLLVALDPNHRHLVLFIGSDPLLQEPIRFHIPLNVLKNEGFWQLIGKLDSNEPVFADHWQLKRGRRRRLKA